MIKYLITGGTGFIGANVVRRLASMNQEAHLLAKENSNMWRIEDIKENLNIHPVNLLDRDNVEKVILNIKPDVIFHFAVYGAYPFQQDVDQILQTNILGTANLINACRKAGFKLFVQTGTSSEYGFKDKRTKETDLLEPNSYYAVSKASATIYCSYVGRAHKLPIIIFRPYSVYGPYEEPTRFMPTLINYALKGKLPRLVAPETARDFIYIDDIVDAYIKAANHNSFTPGEIFNIGRGAQITIKEVVETVKKMLDVNVEPVWNTMEGRIWDTDKWVGDVRKIKKELGWKAKYTMPKGVKKMIDWFRENVDVRDRMYNMQEARQL